MSLKEDKELQKMRQQVTTLFPQLSADILKMDKSDLAEIIELSKTANQTPASNKEKSDPDKKQRTPKIQAMIQEILKYFPETAAEFDTLDDNDIEEIYAQVNLGKKAKPAQGKRTSKEQINVTQMKNTLIDRLPEFKNEIISMPDDEIIKMYNDLQQEELKSKKKTEIQKKAQIEECRQNSMVDINTGGYSKKEMKESKRKHKCKITLYLDEQDFKFDEKGEQGRKEGLKTIMEKLQRAFSTR